MSRSYRSTARWRCEFEEWLDENMTGDKAVSLYKGAWEKWEAWARRQQWPSPFMNPRGDKLENEDRLLGFLGYVGWLGASAATLKQLLFAIKDKHKRCGAGDCTEGMFRVWLLVNSLDRRAERRPRRLGATPGMMKWINRTFGKVGPGRGEESVDAAVVAAALTTAWFFMLRAKEFCDSSGVDESMVVRGCDVKLTETDVTLQFRKTKPDQEAFGSCKSYAATDVPDLCPVMALKALQLVAPRRFEEGPEALLPLFRWATGQVIKRVEVQELLKRAARAEGLPEERFLSHSLRIGGASALFQASGEIELVKRMGRWSSSAVQRYLHDGGDVIRGLSRGMANVDKKVHYT